MPLWKLGTSSSPRFGPRSRRGFLCVRCWALLADLETLPKPPLLVIWFPGTKLAKVSVLARSFTGTDCTKVLLALIGLQLQWPIQRSGG